MKILFEHDYLYYLPQFEPIVRWFIQQGKHEIFLSLNESVSKLEKKIFKQECNRLSLEGIDANFEPQRRRILKEMNFDLIFFGNKSSLSAIRNKSSFCIMVYHGIGLKQSYYTDLSKEMDLICVESKERASELSEKGFEAVATGFTKLDLLKLDHHKSNDYDTLLYAPTFFPSSLQKTIPFLSDYKNVNIKIKLHHFYWTHNYYARIREQLAQTINSLPNIQIVPFEQYSILPLFEEADVLISDYSSTLFEFLHLNRPIIQTDYYSLRLKYKLFPKLLEKRLDTSRMSQINFTEICDKPENLWQICQESLRDPERLEKERSFAKDKFLGSSDGNATNRLIQYLNEIGIPIGAAC
tara:strand:+ start:5371 stop:6432 length:1062 start_codon:yes stop_codon:yes gene_type:complete